MMMRIRGAEVVKAVGQLLKVRSWAPLLPSNVYIGEVMNPYFRITSKSILIIGILFFPAFDEPPYTRPVRTVVCEVLPVSNCWQGGLLDWH